MSKPNSLKYYSEHLKCIRTMAGAEGVSDARWDAIGARFSKDPCSAKEFCLRELKALPPESAGWLWAFAAAVIFLEEDQ